MRTFWKKTAGPVDQPGQPRQPMAPRPPKPLTISNAKEFREALAGLRTYKGLSLERLNENATAAGEPLPPSTVTSTLRRDQLPSLKFVTQYLQACGLSDDEQIPWGEAWHAVNDGVAPVKRSRNWTQALSVSRLVQPRRLHLSIALVTAAVVAAGAGVVWWQHEQDEEAAARAAQQQQREDDQKVAAERKRRCGTANQALLSTAAGECVGITDGRDGHSLFGEGLQPALAAIDAENRAVTKSPGYVTVALLGPLTDGPNSLSGGRAVHQVEGAFIAQHRANQGNAYPKIRLVLANTGSEQRDWRTVTDWLKPMTSTKDRLVAVTGMGLSRQETIDAARALSKASIPMIGDLITAAGLDTTGTIDNGPKITGLVRVAPTVNTQLAAISRHLQDRPGLKTAALVSAPFTPNNTPDLYTQSLEKAFYDHATGLRPYLDRGDVYFNFDVRNGADRTSLNTISKNLCGRVTPDLVFYAGRATYLPTFLENLHQRQCRTTPITVVTGSDAATLDRKIPALNDPDAPISVLYVPLADPAQLSSKNNPDRALYKAFADEFGRPHHGHKFDPGHLASGWAVMAHDAFLTASLAIGKAVDPPQTPPHINAVGAQLYLFDTTNVIEGAGGIFRIDTRTGNRISTHDPRVVQLGTTGD